MIPRQPSLPRLPRLPSRSPQEILPLEEPEGRTDETDANGLLLSVFGDLPPTSRYYIAVALDSVGLKKTITPTQQGFGTIPEVVVYGGLLSYGFQLNNIQNGFAFQSELLGGRVPGGSVGDFVIFVNGRRIACFVHSFFHSVQSPFGGAAKVMEEGLLYQRIVGQGQADVVVMVNHPEDNTPLELGPDYRVNEEIERAIQA